MEKLNLKFLQSLATQYPSVAKACTEIINLQAILNLPKETEHFVSDVHGEYEQFLHILKKVHIHFEVLLLRMLSS